MNLPELGQLRNDQSTYITFQKALLDLDIALHSDTEYYFSKVVALNLPVWVNPNFFIDLSSIGIISTNPNVVVPKVFQYYLENICRNNIGINDEQIDEIVEIAFWKSLNKMGLSMEQIQENIVTFQNKMTLSNFIKTENNNGWGELIAQIPNKCKKLTPVWKNISNIANTVQTSDTDTALYDNIDKEFIFSSEQKKVLDFENFIFEDEEVSTFDFNCLLLFYKDSTGKDKLHGINFIFPFEDNLTSWSLETFTQKTNVVQTMGYQFIFNLKTCNNEASMVQVYELNEQSFYNEFGETLGKLNSFLEEKMRENQLM